MAKDFYLNVQIMDPSKAIKKHVGVLNVKVIQAIKLKKKDLLGGSNPFLKLTLSRDKVPGHMLLICWCSTSGSSITKMSQHLLKLVVYVFLVEKGATQTMRRR